MLHQLAERDCFEVTCDVSEATELLASSPHGAVWRATWQSADVAIKASVSIKGDTRPVNLLPHSNIVHVFHRSKARVHGTGEECLVEVRELCTGGTLFDLVGAGVGSPTSQVSPSPSMLTPRSPLEPELVQLMRWFRQIVLAVAHCHRHRVVCGQLRREHVQLTSDGDIKLLGFQHASSENTIQLKPWHPLDAPELKGRSSASLTECFAADIYAVGSLVGLLGGLHVTALHSMGNGGKSPSFARKAGKSTPPSSLHGSYPADLDQFDDGAEAPGDSCRAVDQPVEAPQKRDNPGCASSPGASPSSSRAGGANVKAIHFFPTPVRKLLAAMTAIASNSRPTAEAAASRLCPLGGSDLHQTALAAPPCLPKAHTPLQIRCPGWSDLYMSADEVELLLRSSLKVMSATCIPCGEHVALGTKGSRALIVFVRTSLKHLHPSTHRSTSSTSTEKEITAASSLGYNITKVYSEEVVEARNHSDAGGGSSIEISDSEPENTSPGITFNFSYHPRFLALILISAEDATDSVATRSHAVNPVSAADSPHAGYPSPSPPPPPHRIDVRRLRGSHEAFHAFFRRLCAQMAIQSDGKPTWKMTPSPVTTQWWLTNSTARGSVTQCGMLPRASSYEASLSSLGGSTTFPNGGTLGHPPTPVFLSPSAFDVSGPLASGEPVACMSRSRRQNKGKSSTHKLATIAASGSWSCSLDAMDAMDASEAVPEGADVNPAHTATSGSSSSSCTQPGSSAAVASHLSAAKDAHLPITRRMPNNSALMHLDQLSIRSRAAQVTASKQLCKDNDNA